MPIRLYDLCGADPQLRFSPYCWRAKLALRHKGADFETVATPFTAIPRIGDGGHATVPVLEDGGTRIGDSFAIAEHLEATMPDRPRLFAEGPAGRAAARLVEGYANLTLSATIFPWIARDILDRLAPEDQAYFRPSREKRLGRSLEEAAAGREGKLGDLRKALAPMRHALRHAPFLGGDTPLYVDHIVAGTLLWAAKVSDFALLDGEDEVAAWFGRVTAGADG
jgi:Glutathione S-transferase